MIQSRQILNNDTYTGIPDLAACRDWKCAFLVRRNVTRDREMSIIISVRTCLRAITVKSFDIMSIMKDTFEQEDFTVKEQRERD